MPDPFQLTRKYQESVGNDPRRDIPFLAGAAGLGTYALAKPLVSALVSAAGTAGGPQMQQGIQDYLAPGGDVEKTRRRLTIMAALAAAAYGVYKHGDTRGGWQGMKASLTDPDYWKKNPQRVEAYKTKVPPTLAEQEADAVSMTKTAYGLDEGFNKNPYFRENIPVGASINLIRNDPILFQSSRNKVSSLLTSSASGTHTSSFNLTNAAVNAGVDFGAAYLFGQGVGKILAIPQPVVNRVSMAGGLAAAVIGSGVLKQL